MNGSVFMPESFCFEAGEYGAPLHNLIRESDLYSVDHVMNWQAFFNEYIASADLAEKQSDAWATKATLKALKPDVRHEVNFELTEVPDEVYGAATTIKIALSKLSAYSFEMVHLIQSFFKNFDIRKYPDQNVVTASQHAKSMGGILSITGDLPARAVQYILVGMAKSTNDRFNILCNQLMSQDEMTYQQPLPGQSTSQAVLKDLSTVLNHLT
jgi:hypothetical protein